MDFVTSILGSIFFILILAFKLLLPFFTIYGIYRFFIK